MSLKKTRQTMLPVPIKMGSGDTSDKHKDSVVVCFLVKNHYPVFEGRCEKKNHK